MVHHLAVPQSEDRSLSRLVAVARGDGCVALYNGDGWAQQQQGAAAGSTGRGAGKRASGSSSGSSSGGRGAGKRASSSSSGSSSGGKGRQKGDNSNGNGLGQQQQQVEAALGRVCLGPEQGGHTAAVSCLSFLHGSQWRQLLSGGNDCRLLLWNWQRAAGCDALLSPAAAGCGGGPSSGCGRGPISGRGTEPAAAGAAGGEGEDGGGQLIATEVRHGRKVNWVCSFEAVGGANVAVADTSKRLTLLSLC